MFCELHLRKPFSKPSAFQRDFVLQQPMCPTLKFHLSLARNEEGVDPVMPGGSSYPFGRSLANPHRQPFRSGTTR